MASAGDQVDIPDSFRVIGDMQTLTPEWREAIEEMVVLINALSTELKALQDQVNGN